MSNAPEPSASPEPDATPLRNLKSLFERLRHAWQPGLVTQSKFSRHGEAMNRIFDRLQSDDRLAFLDAQLYPQWRSVAPRDRAATKRESKSWLPTTEGGFRAAFYLCNSMIQLMENVYLDLDLAEEHAHPDNRGWMNVFHHWAWAGMFRLTWSVCASTYGVRFQRFAEEHLGLRLGDLELDSRSTPGASKTSKLPGDWPDTEWPDDDLAAGASEPIQGEIVELVKRASAETLINFLESRKIQDFAKLHRARLHDLTVVALRLVVQDPTERESRKFTVGFGLITRGKLVYFRIQDHLRKMGLGRRGLRALIEEGLVDGFNATFVEDGAEGPIAVRFRRMYYETMTSELRARTQTAQPVPPVSPPSDVGPRTEGLLREVLHAEYAFRAPAEVEAMFADVVAQLRRDAIDPAGWLSEGRGLAARAHSAGPVEFSAEDVSAEARAVRDRALAALREVATSSRHRKLVSLIGEGHSDSIYTHGRKVWKQDSTIARNWEMLVKLAVEFLREHHGE